MNINFPIPPNPHFTNLVNVLRQAFLNVVSTNEAVGRILLRSSTSGMVYEVTIDDSGTPALVVTLNDGKGRV